MQTINVKMSMKLATAYF